MKVDLSNFWTLQGKKVQGLSTRFPGSVLSTLLAHHVIGDPNQGLQEEKAREWLQDDYSFSRSFKIDKSALKKTNYLVLEGVDTLCDVFLNGQLLLSTNDMNIRYLVLLRKNCIQEENKLELRFHSAYGYIEDYPNANGVYETYAYTEKKSPCLRKNNASFGWDWGPNLADMGIFRPIYLLSTDLGYFSSFQERTHFGKNGEARADLDLVFELVSKRSAMISCSLTLAPEKKEIAQLIQPLQKGHNHFSFAIPNPRLWYPSGYGEQPLYEAHFSIQEVGDSVTEEAEQSYCFGLREIKIDDSLDSYGRNFALFINGKKVFLKGANYIPEDSVLSRVTPERSAHLLSLAKEANFNAIRVWGGGYYPDDSFYEECDLLGLLVFQDLMFACASYDYEDLPFRHLVEKETRAVLQRISYHPCLYLVAGNNEIEDGIRGHGFKKAVSYEKLFCQDLRKIVEAETDLYYLSSTPTSGSPLFAMPNDMNYLDMHYWDGWGALLPFSSYFSIYPRLLSEFGIQSLPNYETLRSYAKESEMALDSPVMLAHQKNPSCNEKILHYVQDLYPPYHSFRELVYLSQLAQAKGIQTAVEHLRQNKARCNGALYWQLNDNWPGQTWSAIDYDFGLKALYFASKRFYNPILISAFLKDGQLGINVSNDSLPEASYEMKVIQGTFAGDILLNRSFQTPSIPFASDRNVLFLDDPFVGEKTQSYLQLLLFDKEGNLLSENFFQKDKDKDLAYPAAHFQIRLLEDSSFSLQSDVFAKDVFLEEEGIAFSDNYFSLTPHEEKILRTSKPLSPSKLHITCLNNLGK